MYATLEECRQAWESAGAHGSRKERILRNARWIEYYRHIAQGQSCKEVKIDPHAAEVAGYLRQAGILHLHSTVLDIGAGTGAYTLAFAGGCAQVCALDMDRSSVNVLLKHACHLELSNIQCAQNMWETYHTDKKFSFVFSSMCPAICTYEDLLKMESMAEEACCLIAVTRGSFDLHRRNLMQLLSVKPRGGMTTEALWYYEMLYLMGRQSDVNNWTRHYEYDISIEEACLRNEIYFQIFGIDPNQSRPLLRDYFMSKATHGLVHDESHLNTALICWHPNRGK